IRSFSMSPFSSSSRSSSYDRSKWSSMARFWLEVTMITCSMPDATASSTAYWMTGLSTSGSISLGWAFVAGRKRVPHPAAGKTAFRTRMKPRSLTGTAVLRGYHRGRIRPTNGARPAQLARRGERPDDRAESLGLIEIREVCRPADQRPARIGCGVGERALRRAEEQVVLAVDEERGSRVGGEQRPEPPADEGSQGDDPALEGESAFEDRVGDRRWKSPPEEPAVDRAQDAVRHDVEDRRESAKAERLQADRVGGRAGDREAVDALRPAGGEGHRDVPAQRQADQDCPTVVCLALDQ